MTQSQRCFSHWLATKPLHLFLSSQRSFFSLFSYVFPFFCLTYFLTCCYHLYLHLPLGVFLSVPCLKPSLGCCICLFLKRAHIIQSYYLSSEVFISSSLYAFHFIFSLCFPSLLMNLIPASVCLQVTPLPYALISVPNGLVVNFIEHIFSLRGIVFWNVTPCSPVVLYRRLGGTYCLHLQGLINETMQEAVCCLLGLFFVPENGGSKFLQNAGKFFTGLHGVTSQTIVLFIVNHREILKSNIFCPFL
jgi:hypothetical protein